MEKEFDREWYEYLQRLFSDREAMREFAEKVIEGVDGAPREGESDG